MQVLRHLYAKAQPPSQNKASSLCRHNMQSSLFNYDLPPERIAQEPASRRDASRLLVVHRDQQSIEHRRFSDIVEYLGHNDLIFRNSARVLPARLFAHRPSGGRVECLLLRPATDDGLEWWCLLRPGRRLPVGSSFSHPEVFEATVAEKTEGAEYRVRFELQTHTSVAAMAEALGKMPLPPYIERQREDDRDHADKERYQTVYASQNKAVAAAAPTAGLHFTPEIFATIAAQGATFHDLVLHVGMGTFKPLEAENLQDHQIHREVYEISEAAQVDLRQPAGKRRVAIGTTSVRSIEDYLKKTDRIHPALYTGEADIFIYPPARFQGVDALVTNFHQPMSTLLCLVSSFLRPGSDDGIAWLKEIYAEAIAQKYRFLSYGDAMLIL